MKTAVILFNLGGPDKLENVRPFLFNLFNDRAIIDLPNPFRYFLARFISGRRNVKAQGIYSKIGGKSPIVELTQMQAEALQKELGDEYKVFVCMRYWHPMSAEVEKQVAEYKPDKIIFLPLYPQYSTTTTASSFADYLTHCHSRAGGDPGFVKLDPSLRWDDKIRMINYYHLNKNFIAAHVDLLRPAVEKFAEARVLFSAHGLPEKVIKKGDPYQKQIEESSGAIARELGLKDWRICYQSKVGPLPWLKPNTADEIVAAGKDIILVPISFVSEHSETLVELDIDFNKLAQESGIKNYIRIPALGTHPLFIKALADLSISA